MPAAAMAQQSSRPPSAQNHPAPSLPALSTTGPSQQASAVPSHLAMAAGYAQLEGAPATSSSLTTTGAAAAAAAAVLASPGNQHPHPQLEGVLGPNKDGRVRNPVPSKLKGKTDNKQGNFGVMHMGSHAGKKSEAPGRDAAAERDAAARRTSENTASAAKAAQHTKYVPPRKKMLEVLNQPSRASPFGARDDRQRPSRPLAPDETKQEQARLLTLLRSINPVTVVDQICKAVAYFGGIPGAPPPEDGIFPESMNTRETGALFIGWLAEIFPDLSSPEMAKQDIPGSKKGKGRVTKADLAASDEPPNPRNGFGYGQAVAPVWNLPPSLPLGNSTPQNPPHHAPEAVQASTSRPAENGQPEQPQSAVTSTPQQTSAEVNSATASSGKRGRGRPKGSRNRGKNDSSRSDDVAGNDEASGQVPQHAIMETSHQPTEPVKAPVQPKAPAQVQPTPAQQTIPQPQNFQYPPQSWHNNSAQPSRSVDLTPLDELSREERAVLEAFRHQDVPATKGAPVAANAASAKVSPAGGVKRKRAPAKPKPSVGSAPSAPTDSMPSVTAVNHLPASNNATSTMPSNAMQWPPLETSNQVMPPAPKRQRKPQMSVATDPPSRTQTASALVPPNAPSSIPDSMASSSQSQSQPQQGASYTRPPAEGLEAHYEKFASQQNGHSLAQSTGPQLTPQQQLRQQQKPTSIPPQSQQMTAQTQQMPAQKQQVAPQTHQVHQQKPSQKPAQKHQQTSSRDDQTMNQTAPSRSNSTGFYNQNQRSSSTGYNQPYGSHPTSQPLYGSHQASPQISNTQMSNSSFRSNSTHTLANSTMSQASPQFSEADTYRTASPHTITQAQPSPSYAQPTNTYRSNSTHSIAQPSPTYSQAGNNYRTTSAISATQQPNPSYSRPQSQAHSSAHQSHYSHFPDTYVDLPALDALGPSTTASHPMATSNYGQNLALPNTSSRAGNNSSLYGTSNLTNAYDATSTDLLRGAAGTAAGGGAASRSAAGNSAYGTSNAMGAAFNDLDMRTRFMGSRQR